MHNNRFVDNETKPTVAMTNRKQMDLKIIWTLVASFVKLSEEPSDAVITMEKKKQIARSC